jgi:hypothetical protein
MISTRCARKVDEGARKALTAAEWNERIDGEGSAIRAVGCGNAKKGLE